jgi:iron complex outermembrane receptor protein
MFPAVRQLAVSVVATAVMASIGSPACAQAKYRFDVSPQPLARALNALAQQAGINIYFNPTDLEGMQSTGLRTEATADEALKSLLIGTGLTWRKSDDKTVVIVPAPAGAAADSASPTAEGVRLAQAEHGDASSPDASNRQSATARSRPEPVQLEEVVVSVPEILVKGARSQNADIRRTEDDIQPYVVFGAEEIRRSGATNADEFLRSRLPQNAAATSFSQSGISGGGRSQINLRGLSGNQTVVLVNGRRMANASTFGSNGAQPDINGIPVDSIERIEILPSTASGIYGGGATGGVVNIITRKDFSGVQAAVLYGQSSRGDAEQERVDLSGGASLFGGKTNVSFSGSYAESGILRGEDRDFTSRSLARQFANNPAAFTAPPVGYTGNIVSQNGANLVLDNGTALNSPRTFIPIGYAGPATDGGAALASNAGRFNLDAPAGGMNPLLTGSEISSASLGVRQTIFTAMEAYGDFSLARNVALGKSGGSILDVLLPANAANNPFTAPIRVSVPVPNLTLPTRSETETVQGVAGLIVRLPHTWTTAFEYGWSRARVDLAFTSPALGDPDGAAGPGVAPGTALANGTLNPVRDFNAFPIDFSPYRLPSPNFVDGPVETTLGNVTVRVGGPALELPAGPLAVSGVLEHREEKLEPSTRVLTLPNGTLSSQLALGGSQAISSMYAEANAPIFSPRNARALFGSLELLASVRRDDYRLKSAQPQQIPAPAPGSPLPAFTWSRAEFQATSFTLGAMYSPISDLTLRASYGTGFLPPSLGNIVTRPSTTTSTMAPFVDPKRGNLITSGGTYRLTSGGNPALRPEESDSHSAGIVLTPRWLPGLRVSVDYVRIEKSDEIFSGLAVDTLLALEDSLPGRVIRDPLTPGDAALGYTGGVVREFDFTAANVSSALIEAIDIQADYEWSIGRFGDFHAYTMFTNQTRLARKVTSVSPEIEGVGHFDGSNFAALKWRGNAGLSWNRVDWTFDWNAQVYDSYRPYLPGSNQTTIDAMVLNQGSDRVRSQIYHDVTILYSVPVEAASDVLRGMQFRLSAENVFDSNPPIRADVSHFANAYSTFGDPRLRRFAFSVRKAF